MGKKEKEVIINSFIFEYLGIFAYVRQEEQYNKLINVASDWYVIIMKVIMRLF